MTRQHPDGSRNGILIIPLLLVLLLLSYDGSSTGIIPVVHGLEGLLTNMKRYHPNWSPEAIVDVGANKGKWSTASRKFYPNAKLLLLEATPVHDTKLTSVVEQLGNAEFQINILSGKTGDTVDWFEGGDTTGNSMFRESTKFYTNAIPNKRTTITLDDAIQKSHLKGGGGASSSSPPVTVDMIKLDVQGAELLVLEGASRTLAEATFVQIENSVIEYNTGGACIYEVDEILRSYGFFLYDMEELARNPFLFKTKGVGQFDSLYVRPTSNRLPTDWVNCTFCGQGRQQKQKPNSKQSTTTTTTTNNCNDNSSNIQLLDQITNLNQMSSNQNPILLCIACFITGLMVGRRTNTTTTTTTATSGNRTRKQQRKQGNWFRQRV